MDTFELLNDIYLPLCKKAADICGSLKAEGFEASQGFYNNHYVRRGGGFVVEHFPIPVISVTGACDIGVDVGSVWAEITLDAKMAARLDYSALARDYRLEVYGADNFLHDFLNSQIDSGDVSVAIADSGEKDICLCFYFDFDCGAAELAALLRLF